MKQIREKKECKTRYDWVGKVIHSQLREIGAPLKIRTEIQNLDGKLDSKHR